MSYRRFSSYSKEEQIKAYRFTTILWAIMAICFFVFYKEIGVISIYFGICMVIATVLSYKSYKDLKKKERKDQNNK